MGGLEAYARGGLHGVRLALQGESNVEEWHVLETSWLKNDIKLMHKHTKMMMQAGARMLTPELESWCTEVSLVGEQLAEISPPGDSALALYYRGWALARLSRVDDARGALELAAALPNGDDCRLCVVEASNPFGAVDPTCRVVVLDVTDDMSEAHQGRSRCVRSGTRFW